MIRNLTTLLLLTLLVLALLGCKPDKSENTARTNEKIIAKVGGQVLYGADIREMIPGNISKADSLAFLNRYADAWVRKHLLLARAEAAAKDDAGEIEQKIVDYRHYLQLQVFEKQYVGQNLDTNVTDTEVAAYYRANPENFALPENIARAWLASFPKSAPNLGRARNWMRGNTPKQRKELQSYCYRFAKFYHLDDSSWIKFDELIRQTPFRKAANQSELLKNNRFTETSDEQNVYLLTTKEVRLSSQTAPLPFVRRQIRDLIINKRKVTLIHELEKKVYEEARKAKSFQIMVR